MDCGGMRSIEQEPFEALVRRAKAERDRELGETIARAAKAVANFFRTAGESIREVYEAERIRSASQADSAMRRWEIGC